ncbi:TetR/AcrR family transcriptional regulator [Pseudonocardia sp. K10HN5]|uniref:TetR/AcrR family transcriptional regulator n=2 Tax=Pseudonocardia acidicola TaxID=2724939 RepID=A0ABX1SB90_9PSEU|nr:TetR/AcrR family transcriptional regulator [Pseudonocardia acidicola]NMH98829.1 TetR/AcrR family transcriptional regulator [Pseudonocardia acidicola]
MTPQRRREHLIRTALELYGRLPPDQLSADDVARAADVSRALFYRYFGNVAELHVAALGTVVDELISRIALPADGTLVDQLRAALGEFLSVVERHANAYVALLRSGSVISTSETDALVDGVRDHIVAMIVERMGVAAPSPLLLLTIRSWVSVVEGASLSWLQERELPRERLEAWLVDQLLAMLLTTAEHDDTIAPIRAQ